MGFMTKNSRNMDFAGGREAAYCTLSGVQVLALRDQASAHGVEWHHAAGHSAGRAVIAFFPKTLEEEQKIDRLAAVVRANNAAAASEKKAAQAAGLPTSKAALWRHLESHGGKDCGFGGVDFKEGKYGFFVPTFGEVDGHFYFSSAEIAAAAKKLLKL